MSESGLLSTLLITAIFFVVVVLLALFFNIPAWILRPAVWAFVLAGCGLVCGFLGPSLLHRRSKPSSAWLGIWAGAYASVIGGAGGFVSALLELDGTQNIIGLAVGVVAVSAYTLFVAVED